VGSDDGLCLRVPYRRLRGAYLCLHGPGCGKSAVRPSSQFTWGHRFSTWRTRSSCSGESPVTSGISAPFTTPLSSTTSVSPSTLGTSLASMLPPIPPRPLTGSSLDGLSLWWNSSSAWLSMKLAHVNGSEEQHGSTPPSHRPTTIFSRSRMPCHAALSLLIHGDSQSYWGTTGVRPPRRGGAA